MENKAWKGVKMVAGGDGTTDGALGRPPDVRVRKAVRRVVEDVLRSGVCGAWRAGDIGRRGSEGDRVDRLSTVDYVRDETEGET